MNRIPSVALIGLVAGTVGTMLYSYFETSASFTIAQLPEFAAEHWRSLAGAWLSFYGTSVLFLEGAAALGRSRSAPSLRTRRQGGVDFLYRLVANQYFSCLVLLFVLGWTGLSFEQAGSPAIAVSFAPFIGLVVAGLVAWSVYSAIVLFGITAGWTTELPARRQLAPGLPVCPPDIERELQNLAGLIQEQRPLIEATRETTAALYDLGKAIHANLGIRSDRGQEPSSEADSDHPAADLHTAVALLQGAIRELRGIRGSLDKTHEPRTEIHASILAVDRSELAQELRELQNLLEQRSSSQMGTPR